MIMNITYHPSTYKDAKFNLARSHVHVDITSSVINGQSCSLLWWRQWDPGSEWKISSEDNGVESLPFVTLYTQWYHHNP